jgi:hypothetical protein
MQQDIQFIINSLKAINSSHSKITEQQLYILLDQLALASDILSNEPEDRFARCTDHILKAMERLRR